MGAIIEHLNTFWEQAFTIWLSGGWCMIAIALNALVLFALGMHVHLKLRGKGLQSVPEKPGATGLTIPPNGKARSAICLIS